MRGRVQNIAGETYQCIHWLLSVCMFMTLISCAPKIHNILSDEHQFDTNYRFDRLIVLPIISGHIDPQLISAVKETIPPYMMSRWDNNQYLETLTDYVRSTLRDESQSTYIMSSNKTRQIIDDNHGLDIVLNKLAREHTLDEDGALYIGSTFSADCVLVIMLDYGYSWAEGAFESPRFQSLTLSTTLWECERGDIVWTVRSAAYVRAGIGRAIADPFALIDAAIEPIRHQIFGR